MSVFVYLKKKDGDINPRLFVNYTACIAWIQGWYIEEGKLGGWNLNKTTWKLKNIADGKQFMKEWEAWGYGCNQPKNYYTSQTEIADIQDYLDMLYASSWKSLLPQENNPANPYFKLDFSKSYSWNQASCSLIRAIWEHGDHKVFAPLWRKYKDKYSADVIYMLGIQKMQKMISHYHFSADDMYFGCGKNKNYIKKLIKLYDTGCKKEASKNQKYLAFLSGKRPVHYAKTLNKYERATLTDEEIIGEIMGIRANIRL